MAAPPTTRIHHLNCGTMQAAGYPPAVSHCLLLEDPAGLALVDTGVGLLDVRDPETRLGRQLVDVVGWKLREEETAVRQVERLGFRPADVRHVVLTHADPDHTGGLADLPHAQVHVAAEEFAALGTGHWRYVPAHFAHRPRWRSHELAAPRDWFGLPARPVTLNFADEVLLVALPGHTAGHHGVAIGRGDRWVFHVGDAYYLRDELAADDHPISQLATARADDDARRRQTLDQLRRLQREHADRIEMFGYHDPTEMPGASPLGHRRPRAASNP